MKVAITGNIGSGKSTFTKILAGILTEFKHVDIDALVARLYSDRTFCNLLLHRFGTFERKAVSDIVFADPNKRKYLEKWAGDTIGGMLQRETANGNSIVEFPLLYEMGSAFLYDQVVTVFCDEETQMARVRARDNISDEKIKSIVGAQMSIQLKTALADHTIDTNADLQTVTQEAYKLAAKLRVGTLRERFINRFDTDDRSYSPLWDAIETAYTEPHRAYHTLEHLAYLFFRFDQIRDSLNYPEIVEQAIWFHDFVYYTENPSLYNLNEINSAKAMFALHAKHQRGHESHKVGGHPVLATAGEYILSTKEHQITSPYILANPDLKHDCELFLDLDLSVLFSDTYTLKAFDDGVRQEFISYSYESFATGRVAALTKFLDRPQILYSKEFADQEPQARYSLESLVKRWQE
jgi:dephospho-CoA kinase